MKTFYHFFGGLFGLFLGMEAWFSPHLDWSKVKDEGLFSVRGLVVLGMLFWVVLTHWMAAFMSPSCTKCSKVKLALVDLMNFQKRSVLTSRQPVQDAFNKVRKSLDGKS